MKCTKCPGKAVYDNPRYCKEHFLSYFEQTVKDTIKKYSMLEKKDRVCVAVSGGKDSTVILFILKRLGYDVEGLALDEGIVGYRDKTLDFLRQFCKDKGIKLNIFSYKDEFGKRLDEIVPKGKPACIICGTFRRDLLNKHSSGYDKIATGHNLDDEAQAVLMNIFKSQSKLFFRQGPSSARIDGFTKKVKPLYFLTEKEVRAYAFLRGFDVPFVECPYSHESLRDHVRDSLNSYEASHPGSKRNIIMKFLSLRGEMPVERVVVGKCIVCGSPSSSEVCKACRLREQIND